VAIYGRGGIGKSTTNNIVTCLPEMGKKAWLSVAIPREKR
jgi:nitrogenase subunit NifH